MNYYDDKLNKHLNDFKFLFTWKGLLIISLFILISILWDSVIHFLFQT